MCEAHLLGKTKSSGFQVVKFLNNVQYAELRLNGARRLAQGRKTERDRHAQHTQNQNCVKTAGTIR
jgi:hypothetical protein